MKIYINWKHSNKELQLKSLHKEKEVKNHKSNLMEQRSMGGFEWGLGKKMKQSVMLDKARLAGYYSNQGSQWDGLTVSCGFQA